MQPIHWGRGAAATCGLALMVSLGMTAQGQSPPDRKPILLDCALGTDIDDAFALALATADPTLDLRGVTTVSGNAEDRAWMVCRFLSAIGKKDIPVAFGRGKQPPAKIGAQYQYRYHPAVLFGRTAKPVEQTAVQLLHARLAAAEKKATIVSTGPLTNLAHLLAEYPDDKDRIERIVVAQGARNLRDDVSAAKAVFASGTPLLLLPQEVTTELRMDNARWRRIIDACTPRTLQLQTLYELWQGEKPVLADAAAIALALDVKDAAVVETSVVTVGDAGELTFTTGDSHIRIVKSLQTEPLLDWMERQLTQGGPVLPRELANRTKAIDRGGMPHRVHVAENYETDIERRWWLAGIPQQGNVPSESTRACRGMLTMDFDDQQGDTKTMYRAVVFNPVPGPPMGKNPRLSFRCWLKGSDQLRVQIYSLSNGYHRYLALADLPQERWLDLAVDMTAARRPDGSGGPLSEGERIDDIQFYVDPRAELLIDDIVLYDAAEERRVNAAVNPGVHAGNRAFPRRIHFTGWFDTGKQGQEWPGTFEIPDNSGYFWKAARSVKNEETGQSEIRVNLRGRRPLGNGVQVDFRYKISEPRPLSVVLKNTSSRRELRTSVKEPKADGWQQASVVLSAAGPGQKPAASTQELTEADELQFILDGDTELLVDDVLLYEPGDR